MTLTVAWIRRSGRTRELVIASDSRLRSRGAMDQAQKVFPLRRGDCVLAFAGDAQVAYPFFVQASSALDSQRKLRDRAEDVTAVVAVFRRILNNLIRSWDLDSQGKSEELGDTRIVFGGWSWRYRRFELGFFKYIDGEFRYIRTSERLAFPFRERGRSLVVLGDYRGDYLRFLSNLLKQRFPAALNVRRHYVDFGYEPLEALQLILSDPATPTIRHLIGGAPQMVKTYIHSNTMPFVVRTGDNNNFLFGRKLLPWEKSEFPMVDMSKETIRFFYPGSFVPRVNDLARSDHSGSDGRTILRKLITFLTSGPGRG